MLLDEALPDDELEIVRATVAEHRGELIIGYHKLRARRAGSKRHIDLHITVPGDMTIGAAHEIAEHIEADITATLPNTEVLVHVEPRFARARGRVVAERAGTEGARRAAGCLVSALDFTPSGRVEATSTTVRAISATEKAQAIVL